MRAFCWEKFKRYKPDSMNHVLESEEFTSMKLDLDIEINSVFKNYVT